MRMCGIVGAVDLLARGRVPAPPVFDRMVDALARRGPDGRGIWRAPHGHAALGHRRLAILDPTPAGAQPMLWDNIAITFNGEIYNFKEVRADLERRGHAFHTQCDTEVILHAWREWGAACVSKLNGIFAFAIVEQNHVFLARDPLGIKPLFFSVVDGVLRFASEQKAIIADPTFARQPDLCAIDAMLTLGYVPPPYAAFQGIEQLPPAHTLAFSIGDAASTPKRTRYWAPAPREDRMSMSDALAELEARLHKSVAMQMVSDVPLGAFLSGGLDSASVVREMTRAGGASRVCTFNVGFAQASFDESDAAGATARLLGTDHRTTTAPLDLRERMLSVAETNDDLFADSSLLAVDVLCEQARRHVTVALSGDGADDLLGGYDTYLAGHLTRPWRAVPSFVRSVVKRGVERALPVSTERYNKRDFALRFLRAAERGAGHDFASFRLYLDEQERRALIRPGARADGRALEAYAAVVNDTPGSLLKKMLVADVAFYLPSDMLVKVDRASMRHGLEVRVPFLDVEFVDWALTLPSRFLVSPLGKKKHILRQHVERHIHPSISRRKKTGFNVPIAAGLRGPLAELLLDAVRSQGFAQDGPLDPAAVERMVQEHQQGRADHSFGLYAVLVLALWWRRFQQAPD
jgi:asparagine synthase (glutamine-hydrolysing)